ncbi:MAG: sensor domain-containing diguanylate cyclase, partial [Raoultibacter sp.]
ATLVFEDDRVRFAAEMKEIAAGSRLCARYRMRKKDGSLAWHMAYAARVRMTEEGALGTLLVFDITATSDAPVCTRGKNGQDTPFDQASLRMLNVIVAEHDFETQIMSIPQQEGLSGLGKQDIEPMSRDEFIASGLIHPDSVAAYRAFLKRMETEDEAAVIVRYRVAADTYHWLHLDSRIVAWKEGRPRRRMGLIRFIDDPLLGERGQDVHARGSLADKEAKKPAVGKIARKRPQRWGDSGEFFSRARKPLVFLGLIFLVACLAIAGIFINYSNTLRHEFYQMSIEGMNDYTVAQKAEVESSIHEIENTIAAMVVLAETPDVDPAGEAFNAYLAGWNEKQAFQIDYASLAELGDVVLNPDALPSDVETIERIAQGEGAISEVRYSERLQGYYYSIAQPVTHDGQVVGALRSIVNASDLLKTNQASSQVSLVSAALIKGDGTLVLGSGEQAAGQESLYDALLASGMPQHTVSATRDAVENDSTVATIMLGEREGRMFFLTAIRLNVNDWNIVNITEESGLAQHSDAVLSNTLVTGLLLVAISIGAVFLVFFLFNRMSKKISYEANRYNILSEFTDTVLFEYFYKTDTLTLTPNARNIFFVRDLRKDHYIEENIPLVDIHPDDYHLVKGLLEHPNTQGKMNEIVYRAKVLSGDYRWFSCQCRYVYEGSEVCTAVGKIVDIDVQKAYETRLVQQAQIDALTQIYNKGAAEMKIEELLAQGQPGFLFIIDVNDFKFINDEYGHNTGDRVLTQVGAALKTVFRQTDLVGRTGGDEFIAYLSPSSDLALAQEKVHLLSAYMDKVALDFGVPISLSAGIARFPADGSTYEALFKVADALMYEKKSQLKKKTRLG